MDKRIIWFGLTITILLVIGMAGISYSMYHNHVSEIKALHSEFETKKIEIDRLSKEMVKSKEDISVYKNMIQGYEKKIREYEKEVNQLQNQIKDQTKSIQEVKNRVNF